MKKFLLLIFVLLSSYGLIAQKNFKNRTKTGLGNSLNLPTVDNSTNKEPSRTRYTFDYTNNVLRENLIAKREGITIYRDENGMPAFIVGKPKSQSTIVRSGRSTMESMAYNYMEAMKTYLRFENVEEEFDVRNIESDELKQTHIKMQQMHKGIPVYGAEVVLHADRNSIGVLNGHLFPTPTLQDTNPSISAQQIGSLAMQDVQKSTKVRTLTFAEKALLK